MPIGGTDWLALTPEPALEPEIPICDPHHHFWDFRTQRVHYQRYLLHELADDINSGHNVRSTVFVEARSMYRVDGPEEMRPVGEVEFVQGLAAASASGRYGDCRAAAAIVGHANLNLGDRVEPVLEALRAASPNRFRGIRHSVTWDPHPDVANTAAHKMERQLASNDFRAGALVLARVARVVYGCADPKAGGAGSILNLLQHQRLNHQVEIVQGLLEDECQGLLQAFFRRLRERQPSASHSQSST